MHYPLICNQLGIVSHYFLCGLSWTKYICVRVGYVFYYYYYHLIFFSCNSQIGHSPQSRLLSLHLETNIYQLCEVCIGSSYMISIKFVDAQPLFSVPVIHSFTFFKLFFCFVRGSWLSPAGIFILQLQCTISSRHSNFNFGTIRYLYRLTSNGSKYFGDDRQDTIILKND